MVDGIASGGRGNSLGRIIGTDLRAAGLRPAMRIILVVWVAQILVFAYLIPFVIYLSMKDTLDPAMAESMRSGLDLAVAGPYVMASVPVYGLPVGIALGAVLVSGDYQARTLGLLLARIPHRWTLAVSRLVVMAVACVVMALASVIVALICATTIGAIVGSAGSFALSATLNGIGASALGLLAYAVLGAMFGYLTRSVLGATLSGLGWAIGVEMLMIGMLSGAVGFFKTLNGLTLTTNLGSLAGAIDRNGVIIAQAPLGMNTIHSGQVAVAFIVCWIAVCSVLGITSLCRRDVA